MPLELIVFYGLIFLTIWGGQWIGVRPPGGLAAALLVAFCWFSARRHGDGRERLGWDGKWFLPCLKKTALWAGPFLLVLFVWAALPPRPTMERLLYGAQGPSESLSRWPAGVVLFLGLWRYPLWALAQEYALLSFAANRWREFLGEHPWRVALVNGGAFALVHAPNPLLMGFSFGAGVLFTRIFLAAPHLVPLAFAHAAGGLFLSVIFRGFYPAMMVGPAYLRHVGGGG